MGRHRNIFRKAKVLIQNLFSSNIDFENGIVFDTKNGFNANLKHSYLFKHTQKQGINYNFTTPNLSVFTIIFRVKLDIGLKFNFFSNLEVTLNKTNIFISGANVTANLPIDRIDLFNYILIEKNGHTYSIFCNDTLLSSFTYTATLTTRLLTSGATSTTVQNSYLKDFLMKSIIYENKTIFNISNLYKNLIDNNNLIFRFLYSQNTERLLMFDIVNGVNCTYSISTVNSYYELSSLFQSYNLKYGFDIYTLDSNPTTKLYVPLKYDGTSFGKVIVGYTFVETVTQSGNDFLNCETKILQPNIQILKDADKNYFYFNNLGVPLEKSFSDVYNETLDYIEADKTSNKITNLKLYV